MVDRIKELIREGNIRKIVVLKGDGSVLKEFPLTQGMAVAACRLSSPGLAALGALVAFATDIRIQVVRTGEPHGEWINFRALSDELLLQFGDPCLDPFAGLGALTVFVYHQAHEQTIFLSLRIVVIVPSG